MARCNHLPLWRDAAQLAVLLEGATSTFPRAHKYSLDSELRRHPCQPVCRRMAQVPQITGQGGTQLFTNVTMPGASDFGAH
jgi:hypothetical protein